MSEEDISQEFRLKNIDETRNFLIEKINQNESTSKNRKMSTVSRCVSISDFASLVEFL